MMARRASVAYLAVLSASLVGCYTLQPAGGRTPEVGAKVAFDVNDAGRSALGGSLGPEVSQIEGKLLEQENGEYLLAVSNIRLLRGGEQVWGGERVRIKSEHVTGTYQRRFSRTRTIAASAVGIGFIAFIATRSIIGSGREDDDRLPGDTAQTQVIPIPRP
jgi:hypothetical protein